jgi:hypothetical protein
MPLTWRISRLLKKCARRIEQSEKKKVLKSGFFLPGLSRGKPVAEAAAANRG